METERCPKCGASPVHEGFVRPAEGASDAVFVPSHIRVFRWTRGVPLSDIIFRGCVMCGHLWATLRPENLRSFIEAYGDALAKQDLETGDAQLADGLPDSAEARQASEGVAEIDALIREGKTGHATRRYRELTGRTWGEASNTALGWRALTLGQKLALFGWSPEVLTKEPPDGQVYHPMHDDFLDR